MEGGSTAVLCRLILKSHLILNGKQKLNFPTAGNLFSPNSAKVLLHDPSEFPEVNKKGILVGAGQEAAIAIHAEVM